MKTPLPNALSPEEASKQFYTLHHGTPAERARARETLILSNVALVNLELRKYKQGLLHREDLYQHGIIALITAIDSFSGDTHDGFVSTARAIIRRELASESMKNNSTAHVGEKARERRAKVSFEIKKAEEQRMPLAEAILKVASELGLSAEMVRTDWNHVRNNSRSSASDLDTALDVPATHNVETEVGKHLRHESLLNLVEELPALERDVLRFRLGLDGSDPMTLEQIEKHLSLKTGDIAAAEVMGLARLRHPSRAARIG